MSLIPIFNQLITMNVKPFQYHTQRSTWHLTCHNAISNTYSDFIIAIPCMEMRRQMVIKVHKNDDSIKKTNLRHN